MHPIYFNDNSNHPLARNSSTVSQQKILFLAMTPGNNPDSNRDEGFVGV